MIIPSEKVICFQQEILSWYATHKRNLPWRKTREPYAILVSEVMSQQTQLSRVIPKYITWMQELPTVKSLADVEQRAVLALWSGLGYNRRGLNLHKAAQMLVTTYKGVWPRDVKELEKLPGIGIYTASALACFAFDKQISVIDTNVRKVILLRFGEYVGSSKTEAKQIEQIAEELLPKGRAYEWNQALMDYAALMLKKEKVPVPKQSTFLGSRRSYRGRILKLLVKYHTASFQKLWELSQDKYSKDDIWFQDILDELLSEGLIRKKDGKYTL